MPCKGSGRQARIDPSLCSITGFNTLDPAMPQERYQRYGYHLRVYRHLRRPSSRSRHCLRTGVTPTQRRRHGPHSPDKATTATGVTQDLPDAMTPRTHQLLDSSFLSPPSTTTVERLHWEWRYTFSHSKTDDTNKAPANGNS